MNTFVIVMLIAAAACFALETVGVASRVALLPLGLLAFVLSILVPMV